MLIEFTSEDEIKIDAAVSDHGDTVEFELYELLDQAVRLARARSEKADRKRGIIRPTSTVNGGNLPVRVRVSKAPREGRRRAV